MKRACVAVLVVVVAIVFVTTAVSIGIALLTTGDWRCAFVDCPLD